MLEGGRKQEIGARRSWRAMPASFVVGPGHPERTQRVSQMEPSTRWRA